MGALRISYSKASVGVHDNRLEWSGQYEVIEDRAVTNSKDHFLFVDSNGNQYYQSDIDFKDVEVNLLANNS